LNTAKYKAWAEKELLPPLLVEAKRHQEMRLVVANLFSALGSIHPISMSSTILLSLSETSGKLSSSISQTFFPPLPPPPPLLFRLTLGSVGQCTWNKNAVRIAKALVSFALVQPAKERVYPLAKAAWFFSQFRTFGAYEALATFNLQQREELHRYIRKQFDYVGMKRGEAEEQGREEGGKIESGKEEEEKGEEVEGVRKARAKVKALAVLEMCALDDTFKMVTREFFKQDAKESSAFLLRSLDFGGCSWFSDDNLFALRDCFHLIVRLDLSRCPYITGTRPIPTHPLTPFSFSFSIHSFLSLLRA